MAIKVKTRDWGSDFAAVSGHIANKSAAASQHAQMLKDEIDQHTGHAFGRHGYQADWIAQVIRAVTQVTPDQTFSPSGVEAVIREWNARWVGSPTGEFSKIVHAYDTTGRPVTGPEASGFVPAVHVTATGLESGGFLSPELQQRALTQALILAAPRIGVAQAEYPGIANPWKAVTRCMVVVEAAPSAGFGLGYRRTAAFVPRTRDEVLRLVKGLQEGRSRGALGLPDQGAPLVHANGRALRPESERTAFSGVSDLLDYLGIEAFWQKTALVVLQKNGAAWSRVTMYPCNLAGQGWAPANKIPTHPWSGKVKAASGTQSTLPVPAWRPA